MPFIEIKVPVLCPYTVLSDRGRNSLSPLDGAKAQIGKALDLGLQESITSVCSVLI